MRTGRAAAPAKSKRAGGADPSPFGLTVEQRMASGRVLRKAVTRSSHAKWTRASNRPEAVALLQHADRGRLPELLPVRYGRMRVSPFAFYRGAAALMAWDLARTPATGMRVQACGDCHLGNFGGYGSPERRLVFDINDFDETLPAPWEWDLKRLAASIVLAGRQLGASERKCAEAAEAAARSYRQRMREYAGMRALEAWYSRLDAEIFVHEAKSPHSRKDWQRLERNARSQTALHVFPRITDRVDGRPRIHDRPPLVYHPRDTGEFQREVRDIFHRYRLTLPDDRRVVLDHYHLVDVARKVVGVGSVGTRCAVALLMAGPRDPLFLQFKEARASVLEPYAGRSRFDNHGERVVTGQRMLQAASDVFLGWTRDDHGRDYYFRQLRDMTMKVDLDRMTKEEWLEYGQLCGWALARAHARAGPAARLAGYMGKSGLFDRAIADFAVAYADQTERDHAALVKAIRSRRLPADSAAVL
ncbi:MAG TPA: DUF2252 domain-containing protein [Candidatus Acidoferrales bacterium]|nr:DUF2252 domain-containing protein [Candidatus Acidoferrales bacterium]